jgi:hypothetical protein
MTRVMPCSRRWAIAGRNPELVSGVSKHVLVDLAVDGRLQVDGRNVRQSKCEDQYVGRFVMHLLHVCRRPRDLIRLGWRQPPEQLGKLADLGHQREEEVLGVVELLLVALPRELAQT